MPASNHRSGCPHRDRTTAVYSCSLAVSGVSAGNPVSGRKFQMVSPSFSCYLYSIYVNTLIYRVASLKTSLSLGIIGDSVAIRMY